MLRKKNANKKTVKTDAMLVQTTYCPASVSSLSIAFAMIAEETATGEANSAIKDAYSGAPRLSQDVVRLSKKPRPMPRATPI